MQVASDLPQLYSSEPMDVCVLFFSLFCLFFSFSFSFFFFFFFSFSP